MEAGWDRLVHVNNKKTKFFFKCLRLKNKSCFRTRALDAAMSFQNTPARVKRRKASDRPVTEPDPNQVNIKDAVRILIRAGWTAGLSATAFLGLLDTLLRTKIFLDVVVIVSGVLVVQKWEVNQNTTVADVYAEIYNKLSSPSSRAELFVDNKAEISLPSSDKMLGLRKSTQLFLHILSLGYDTWECLKTFEGHSSYVSGVAFSPDGRTVVSGSWDKTLKLWSVSGGECLKTFEGHSSEVSGVAFSPDGRTVVSGSWDNTLKLWGAGSHSYSEASGGGKAN